MKLECYIAMKLFSNESEIKCSLSYSSSIKNDFQLKFCTFQMKWPLCRKGVGIISQKKNKKKTKKKQTNKQMLFT
jgi:hypothetical protein